MTAEKEQPDRAGQRGRVSGGLQNIDTEACIPAPAKAPRTDAHRSAPMAIYWSIMAEVERRRLALGIPMEKLSEFCGIADRAFPKYLAPHTSSGRQAQWGTLQCIIDALFPDGFDLRIAASSGPALDALSFKYSLRYDRAFADTKSRREVLAEWGRRGGRRHHPDHLSEIGKKGARARSQKMAPAIRSELARRASMVRWARRNLIGNKSNKGGAK